MTATTIQGVAPATVLSDIGAQPAGSYQPLDGDLTAIAALAGVNVIYYRSAVDTWSAVTIGTGLSFNGGTLTAAGQVFYCDLTDAADVATYKRLLLTPSTHAETSASVVCTGTTTDFLIASFITDPGVPGAIDYPAGSAYRRLYGSVSGGAARFRLQVYTRTTGGVETLARDETSNNFSDTVATLQEWLATPSSGGTLSATDRLVVKVSARRISGPTNVTVTLYSEGSAHASQIQTTISLGSSAPISATPPLALSGGNLTIDLSGYQPLDADLTAIAALAGTNTIYYRSAANTWTAVTIGSNMTFSGGTLNSVAGGSGNVSNSGTPTVDQIAVWTDATHIKGVDAATLASQTFNCGRLAYVSATALSFKPYNGDRIKIAGTIYAIPSAGIAGLTNGGLSVSTLYYVYAYNNAGTITGEFSTTSHAVSTTAGNVGTEIKSGDNTRTLIGMVRTDNSSQFNDAAASRLVLSWFNRRDISLAGAHTNGITTTSTSFVEATSNARVNFLTWGEEYVTGGVFGTAANSAVSNTILAQLVIDLASAVLPVNIGPWSPGASHVCTMAGSTTQAYAEGYHFFTPTMAVSAGTGTYFVYATGLIRG